jgi:HEAT repeat protein
MVSAKSGSQPATDPPVTGLTSNGLTSDKVQARRRAIVEGRTGDRAVATELLDHAEPAVRQAALGALFAADLVAGHPDHRLVLDALGDESWTVRRRACELAGRLAISNGCDDPSDDGGADNGIDPVMNPVMNTVVNRLVDTLSDPEALVAEAAAWALGELAPMTPDLSVACGRCVPVLAEMTTSHRDPLCREAAVAALGAIGAPSSLESVLSALGDKPPIRRRATIALAAFADSRADEALKSCLEDRDWQVRQAAEDILGRMD